MSFGMGAAPSVEYGRAALARAQAKIDDGLEPEAVVSVLRAGVRLLRRGWRQSRCTDLDGNYRHSLAPDAAVFTVGGAMVRARQDIGAPEGSAAVAVAVIESLIECSVHAWNDRGGQSFDRIETVILKAMYRAQSLKRKETAA